jgi:predicted DNA-binding transcriptional regulator AlpA
MPKLITEQQACVILECQRSTFYRSYRKRLNPAKKRPGTKSWLFDSREVTELAKG